MTDKAEAECYVTFVPVGSSYSEIHKAGAIACQKALRYVRVNSVLFRTIRVACIMDAPL